MADVRRAQVMMAGWNLLPWPIMAVLVATSCEMSTGQHFPGQAMASTDLVLVRNLSPPGAFEVQNSGPDLELALGVAVQRQQNNKWSDELTDVALIERCGVTPVGNHVLLQHGSKLRPVPWNGMTCGSQCAASCRANIYLGPGRFRFVVSAQNAKQKFYGPAFALPSYEK